MIKRRPLAALVSTGAAISLAMVSSPAHAAPPSGSTPTPGSAGIGDTLFPELGNGGYDVSHYALNFAWSADQTYRVKETIQARATQALSRFDLDLAGNQVGAVSVDGAPATWTRVNEELVITPAQPLNLNAAFTVDIVYSGSTADGVTEPPFEASFPFQQTNTGGFALTNQPHFAHFAFPSNDHPSDKATYDFTISAPVGFTAVANGTLRSSATTGTTTVWKYTEASPMASELVSIAVDRYASVSQTGPHGLPIRSYFPPGTEATYGPIADLGAEQVAWMESQVGPYPFDTYGIQIIDPAHPFSFALENQTLPIYDPAFFTFPRSFWEPILVHELSHQWFGDSVSPSRWSDAWLNEGHATWYEQSYAELKGYGTLEDRMRAEYGFGDLHRAAFGPVAQPKFSDFVDLFSTNIYDGGALVLFALREKVGAAAFGQIERRWVAEHRDGHASTQDFIDLAAQVAGPAVRPFLTDWLFGTTTPPMPNHPDWTVQPVTSGSLAAAIGRAATGGEHRLTPLR
jgi:aminopeptidase N